MPWDFFGFFIFGLWLEVGEVHLMMSNHHGEHHDDRHKDKDGQNHLWGGKEFKTRKRECEARKKGEFIEKKKRKLKNKKTLTAAR